MWLDRCSFDHCVNERGKVAERERAAIYPKQQRPGSVGIAPMTIGASGYGPSTGLDPQREYTCHTLELVFTS